MHVQNAPSTPWNGDMSFPVIDSTAYVHPTAVLIGDVRIGKNVSVYPNVVLRADEGSPIIIGGGSNIQDGVIMHCLKGSSIIVGKNCSIAHGAVIHGPCKIGYNSFVGFNTVVLKAELGKNNFVSHCALVTGVTIKDNASVPAGKVVGEQGAADELPAVTEAEKYFSSEVVGVNEELRKAYTTIERINISHEHKMRVRKVPHIEIISENGERA